MYDEGETGRGGGAALQPGGSQLHWAQSGFRKPKSELMEPWAGGQTAIDPSPSPPSPFQLSTAAGAGGSGGGLVGG